MSCNDTGACGYSCSDLEGGPDNDPRGGATSRMLLQHSSLVDQDLLSTPIVESFASQVICNGPVNDRSWSVQSPAHKSSGRERGIH